MVKIVALSTICADVFDDTEEIRLGGEALNFSMVISKYSHVSISLMGAVGNDYIGQKAMECIKGKKKIDMSCVHMIDNGKTATNKIYHDSKGNRYFKEDSWDGGVYQDFKLFDVDKKKLQESDIVFINYYSPNFQEILEFKPIYGYQLAVDFDVVRSFSQLGEIVRQIDFVFFSGDEQTLLVLKEWSNLYDGIFNATLAEKGSVSFYKGKEYRADAIPVKEIVDTTGCGDSYHAAFLASYFDSHNIKTAMEEGSLAASNTLTFLGGFESTEHKNTFQADL